MAGLLNQPTNVVLNNQLVVFSIRDLEEELRPIAMYIILNYIWNIVRQELKKRILAVDEAWILMQHEDSARFLFGIAKRARKYYLGSYHYYPGRGGFFGQPLRQADCYQLIHSDAA